MVARRSRGRGGGGIGELIALLLAAVVMLVPSIRNAVLEFAGFNTPPTLLEQSHKLKEGGTTPGTVWIIAVPDKGLPVPHLFPIDGTSPRGATATSSSVSASPSSLGSDWQATVNSLVVRPDSDTKTPYNRDDYRHWDNYQRSCWTVREEVLLEESDIPPTLLDSSGNLTTDPAQACEITGGQWTSLYDGEIFTNPDDLDVDHMVPLGNANASGANLWDAQKKEDYANYLMFKDHLIAVSTNSNRSKSDQSPDLWLPTEESYRCQYVEDWVQIKSDWKLSVTQAERNAIIGVLSQCK